MMDHDDQHRQEEQYMHKYLSMKPKKSEPKQDNEDSEEAFADKAIQE
jgi:hypothetical protein